MTRRIDKRIGSIKQLVIVATLAFAASDASAQELKFPIVSTGTTVSNSVLTSGDTVRVAVEIKGQAIVQDIPVPAGVVFILDYSGSMKPNIGALRSAATSVTGMLDASRDRASAVAFSSGVSVIAPLTSALNNVSRAINSHPVGGTTNIAAGLSTGAKVLRQVTEPLRIGILFTDGQPYPNPNEQKSQINRLLREIAGDHIAIHTVGLGNVDEILLDAIARRTGGKFTLSPSSAELKRIFEEIYERESKFLTTEAVSVLEAIDRRLAVVHSSFAASFIPPSVDPDEFKDQMKTLEENFYRTGELKFPVIPELPEKNFFGYTFDIRVGKCDSDKDVLFSLRRPVAEISYYNGQPAKKTVGFDPVTITVRRCGVYLKKEWNERNRTLHIEFVNSFGFPLRDVVVGDSLSEFFHPDLSRLREFEPAPSAIIRNRPDGPDIVKWNVGKVDASSRSGFFYAVKENNNAKSGSIPIQQINDPLVEWLHQAPIFRVLESDLEHKELDASLRGYSGVRSNTKAMIVQELGKWVTKGLTLEPTVVSLPSASAIEEEFFWQIEVENLEYSHLLQQPGGEGLALASGALLVKKIDRGYEVYLEIRTSTSLPLLATSLDFEPTP